jgi:hypothetical protein
MMRVNRIKRRKRSSLHQVIDDCETEVRQPARRHVAVRHVGRLQHPPGRDGLVSFGVGLDALCVLWSTPELATFFTREVRSRDDRRPPIARGDVVAVTYRFESTEPRMTPLAEMPVETNFIQPLTHDSVLVVDCRCEWRPDGPELNAAIFGLDGAISRRGCLGDGISGLQLSESGTIWAGYFDEGVFGNLGWGGTYFDDEAPGRPALRETA